MGQQKTVQVNLTNQRNAAIAFLATQSGVEQIRFTHEGSVGGGGSWAVNAVVTSGGQDYQEILGLTEWSFGGDPMPAPRPLSAPAQTRVIYSDGTSEVLK